MLYGTIERRGGRPITLLRAAAAGVLLSEVCRWRYVQSIIGVSHW